MFRFFLEIATSPIPLSYPSESIAEYDSELDNITSVLSDICNAFDESKRIAFQVEGFGEARWPVWVAPDLAVLLEQLPGLVAWMADMRDTTFILSFYEQGLERMLKLDNRNDLIKIECESWGGFEPDPQLEIISREALAMMIRELLEGFLDQANQITPQIVAHEWFQEWRRAVQ